MLSSRKHSAIVFHSSQYRDFCGYLRKLTVYKKKQSTVERNVPSMTPSLIQHDPVSSFSERKHGVCMLHYSFNVLQLRLSMRQWNLKCFLLRHLEPPGTFVDIRGIIKRHIWHLNTTFNVIVIATGVF